MSTKSAWSLRRRIERWTFALGTAFVSLLALFGCLITYAETERALDAIASEEFEEMIGGYRTSRGRLEDFANASDALQRSHPDDPMAWRVWKRTDGSEWGSFGRPDLVALLPTRPSEIPEIGRNLRYRHGPMSGDLELALLLEGGAEVRSERLFFLTAGAIVVLAAGMSYLSGRFLGARIASTLRRIAGETRASVQADRLPDARADVPVEIADVVEALRESLTCIREESDRSRLLAAGLAHELRTPLQNLRMEAEVSLLRERSTPEYVQAMQHQLHELEELIRAVDNLVNLCAPPEARRARQAESFDLAAEVRLRLQPELARALRADLCLEFRLPETLLFRGDRETLVLTLRNLVSNALDWSPAGGRVELNVRSTGKRWVIEVTDQGPGVPLADRERIFRPFERGAPRPNGRVGYGLGLALVRTVAEAHLGKVEVDSSPSGGALFRLDLPATASD